MTTNSTEGKPSLAGAHVELYPVENRVDPRNQQETA